MNAQDSLANSKANQTRLEIQQMVRILNAIKKASSKGQTECLVEEEFYTANQKMLKEGGYSLYNRGGRLGDNNTIIQWNKPTAPVQTTP